jgi:hypothetical protein
LFAQSAPPRFHGSNTTVLHFEPQAASDCGRCGTAQKVGGGHSRFLQRRLALYDEPQRMIFGATTFRGDSGVGPRRRTP